MGTRATHYKAAEDGSMQLGKKERMATLSFYARGLEAFRARQASLQILHTVAARAETQRLRASQILVLDSSFNPPTNAHLQIATSALQAHRVDSQPSRLVLLLAVQNADKPAQPALFEQRLCMMTCLAEEVLQMLKPHESNIAIDIGVTRLPYFVGKAQALASSENYDYGVNAGKVVPQVHLVGYDTLVRIFNTKYYPPDHTLRPLRELFDHHRLRVTFRPDSDWGSEQEQRDYLAAIADGRRDQDGAEPAWAEHIDLVKHDTGNQDGVSSTKARKVAKDNDMDAVRKLCPPEVTEWVSQNGLYKDG